MATHMGTHVLCNTRVLHLHCLLPQVASSELCWTISAGLGKLIIEYCSYKCKYEACACACVRPGVRACARMCACVRVQTAMF
jgi:hypothetical protein